MAEDGPDEEQVAPPAQSEPEPAPRGKKHKKQAVEDTDPTAKEEKTEDALNGERPEKRVRAQSAFYKPEHKPKPEFKIPEGTGVRLGDIPNIHFRLGHLKTDDFILTFLHSLFYKRPGMSHTRKKNIYEFKGLVFSEQSKDEERALEKVQKLPLKVIDQLLDLFDLPRGTGEAGKKEGKTERLFNFLKSPEKLSEKDISKKETPHRASKPKSATKRKASAPKEATAEKKQKTSTAKKAKPAAKEESEEEEEEEEEEEPAPKSAKKSKKPAKPAPEPAAKEVVADEAGDEDDDEPLMKMSTAAKLPSDASLQAYIHSILEDADMQEMTMKAVMGLLTKKYGAGIVDKKPFIREVVTKFVSAKVAEVADDKEEPAEAAKEATAEAE